MYHFKILIIDRVLELYSDSTIMKKCIDLLEPIIICNLFRVHISPDLLSLNVGSRLNIKCKKTPI